MSVRNLVKSIQDIMRQDSGVDGDAQRISQLCWMFFLKIIDDQEKLKELLKKSPDLLKRLAQSESIMESVLEHQHAAEKKLEETLKKQQDATDTAEKKVDDAVNIAVKLKQGGC